MDNDTRNLEEI